MNLITAVDQDKVVNLDLVQSIQLDHYSASSLITFAFSDKQNVIWRFTNRERADEVFGDICNCSSHFV